MSGFKPLQLVSFVTPETGTHLPSHMISIQPSEVGSAFPFYRKGNHRILKWLPRDPMLHHGKATARFLDSAHACTSDAASVCRRERIFSLAMATLPLYWSPRQNGTRRAPAVSSFSRPHFSSSQPGKPHHPGQAHLFL